MSFQYDQYLARHRANVKRGFDWLSENLPGLMTNTLTAGWNTEFAHDQSKNEPDEYEAYDAYFYGNNRSYEVVQRYWRAWLLHIHRNPHHWQHWILIHDDMEDGELDSFPNGRGNGKTFAMNLKALLGDGDTVTFDELKRRHRMSNQECIYVNNILDMNAKLCSAGFTTNIIKRR